MTWSEIIVLGPFTAISSLLYIYMMIIILRNRHLREASFYMLNVAMGVTDIGSIWSEYLFHRLPDLGIFKSIYLKLGLHSPFSCMCTSGFMFFNNGQKFLLMAIAINRLTAVVAPSQHKTIWSKKNSLTLIVVMSTLFFAPYIFVEAFVGSYYSEKNDSEQGGFNCKMTNKAVQQGGLEFNAYLSMFSALAVGVLYGIIIFALCMNRKNITVANTSRVNTFRTELKLTICVLLHTLLLEADGVTTALIFVWNQRDLIFVNKVIQDLLSGCNPYLLLLFSSALRVKVFWFWKTPHSRTVTYSNKAVVAPVTQLNRFV